MLAFDATPLSSTEAVAAGLELPESIERSVPKRLAEFVHGRLAAKRALTSLGVSLSNARVDMGMNREPVWPNGVVGSITHIFGLAAAIAAPNDAIKGIGIDLERIARGDAQHALRSMTITSAELRFLESSVARDLAFSVHNLDEIVTFVFSAKEALFKAAFPTVRRMFDFSAAEVCDLTNNCGLTLITLEMREAIGPPFYIGSRWTVCVKPLSEWSAHLAVIAW